MKAAIQGQIETVRFLLAQGADHSITDPTRGMCAQGKSVVLSPPKSGEDFNRLDIIFTG